MPSETDLAYAAGLIDGEGSFVIGVKRPSSPEESPSHYPGLHLGMTEPAPVEWLAETFGGSLHWSRRPAPRRPVLQWQIRTHQALAVAEATLPYLRVKGVQAYLVVCFYREGFHTWRRGTKVPVAELQRRETIRGEMVAANATRQR